MVKWLNGLVKMALAESDYRKIKQNGMKIAGVARKGMMIYASELERMEATASDEFKKIFGKK
jgi:hypothetical protein